MGQHGGKAQDGQSSRFVALQGASMPRPGAPWCLGGVCGVCVSPQCAMPLCQSYTRFDACPVSCLRCMSPCSTPDLLLSLLSPGSRPVSAGSLCCKLVLALPDFKPTQASKQACGQLSACLGLGLQQACWHREGWTHRSSPPCVQQRQSCIRCAQEAHSQGMRRAPSGGAGLQAALRQRLPRFPASCHADCFESGPCFRAAAHRRQVGGCGGQQDL